MMDVDETLMCKFIRIKQDNKKNFALKKQVTGYGGFGGNLNNGA